VNGEWWMVKSPMMFGGESYVYLYPFPGVLTGRCPYERLPSTCMYMQKRGQPVHGRPHYSRGGIWVTEIWRHAHFGSGDDERKRFAGDGGGGDAGWWVMGDAGGAEATSFSRKYFVPQALLGAGGKDRATARPKALLNADLHIQN